MLTTIPVSFSDTQELPLWLLIIIVRGGQETSLLNPLRLVMLNNRSINHPFYKIKFCSHILEVATTLLDQCVHQIMQSYIACLRHYQRFSAHLCHSHSSNSVQIGRTDVLCLTVHCLILCIYSSHCRKGMLHIAILCSTFYANRHFKKMGT